MHSLVFPTFLKFQIFQEEGHQEHVRRAAAEGLPGGGAAPRAGAAHPGRAHGQFGVVPTGLLRPASGNNDVPTRRDL